MMISPLAEGFKAESGEAAKTTVIRSCEEPLEESPCKATNKRFEKHPHLLPAIFHHINNRKIEITTNKTA